MTKQKCRNCIRSRKKIVFPFFYSKTLQSNCHLTSRYLCCRHTWCCMSCNLSSVLLSGKGKGNNILPGWFSLTLRWGRTSAFFTFQWLWLPSTGGGAKTLLRLTLQTWFTAHSEVSLSYIWSLPNAELKQILSVKNCCCSHSFELKRCIQHSRGPAPQVTLSKQRSLMWRKSWISSSCTILSLTIINHQAVFGIY